MISLYIVIYRGRYWYQCCGKWLRTRLGSCDRRQDWRCSHTQSRCKVIHKVKTDWCTLHRIKYYLLDSLSRISFLERILDGPRFQTQSFLITKKMIRFITANWHMVFYLYFLSKRFVDVIIIIRCRWWSLGSCRDRWFDSCRSNSRDRDMFVSRWSRGCRKLCRYLCLQIIWVIICWVNWMLWSQD